MSLAFVCFVITAILFCLLGVKVDLGTKANWDMIGAFFVALGLALSLLPAADIHWPVVRRPNP